MKEIDFPLPGIVGTSGCENAHDGGVDGDVSAVCCEAAEADGPAGRVAKECSRPTRVRAPGISARSSTNGVREPRPCSPRLDPSHSLEHPARPVFYQPGLLGITKIWPGKTRLGLRI